MSKAMDDAEYRRWDIPMPVDFFPSTDQMWRSWAYACTADALLGGFVGAGTSYRTVGIFKAHILSTRESC